MTANQRPASTNVTLEEESVRWSDQIAGEGFYENAGSFFWGEAGGNAVMSLEGFFSFGKGPDSPYRVFSGDRSETMYHTFLLSPEPKEGGLADNDFYGTHIDATNPLPSGVALVKESDRAVWKGGNRQYISRPPYWDVKGESLGVEFDVTFGGLGPVHRPYEPWDKLQETRSGGFWVPCWVEGTVTFKGQKYTLENAYGMHVYMLDGHNWDTFELVRNQPYYWIWGINDSLQFYAFTGGELDDYNDAYVWNDGQEFKFTPDQVTLDDVQTWNDPRSGMNWPSRWHLNLNSEKGLLDMNVVGKCRGMFCSLTKSGTEIHYGVFARGNGRFFRPDGHSVPIENMIVYVERGRRLMAFDRAV